jgi:polyhydroxyalkanoate synthesis regulator phasin
VRDAVKGYLTLAAGLTEVTRQRATAAAKALVASGEATAEQVGSLVDDLLAQSRQNREAVAALVTYEVDRALGRVRLATSDEVGQLTERVRALEEQVRRLEAAPGEKAPARRTPGSKAPRKQATGSKAPAKTSRGAKAPAKTASGATRSGAKTGPARTPTPSAADAPRGGPGAAAKTASGTAS